jgi:hypothetical protein
MCVPVSRNIVVVTSIYNHDLTAFSNATEKHTGLICVFPFSVSYR